MARGAAATMKRGPMRGRPTRGNTKQKKSKADAAHDVASLPVTPPFFSFDRAELGEPLSITRVVAVTVPMADLRDRHALHEHVVKKLLHKPYSPSAEEKQQAATTRINNNSTTNGNGKELCEEASASCAARSHRVENSVTKEAKEDEATNTPYVIIHMDHLEVHSDTARQVNSRGDVQLNVMLTITIAQVKRHGLLVGVAEESPFNACMQIKLPLSSTMPLSQPGNTVQGGKGTTSKRRREQKEEEEETMSAETPNAGAAAPVLRMTVRCLEEEPVVAGQAVLVVSEPGGCLRCLALRPPRRAPGPFRLVCDDDAGTTIVCDVVETEQEGKGQGKASGEGKAAAATMKRRRE